MKTLLTITVAASTLTLSTLHAAIISWSASNITNDVTNISTNGSLVDARNGNASNDRTVNGVTFLSVTNSGNLFDSFFRNDNIGNRGYGTVVTNADYRNFLVLGQRSGRENYSVDPATAPTENWTTTSFTGLIVGHQYEVQIWASDVGTTADGVFGTKALVLGDGSSGAPVFGDDAQLLYEVSDLGAGQYGTGTFVADSTTQSFNLQTYNDIKNTPTAITDMHFSNGWQIRDLGAVPEPSALLLGALSTLLLLRRRRD